MRDYIVLAIVFLSAPVAVVSPYYGILMWSWIAYFNPHRYGWGIAHNFPVAVVIAVPTLVGALFAKKNTRIFGRETVLLGLLWAWFAFTTYYISTLPVFAAHVQDATLHLADVSKILLMTLVTVLLVTSKEKLRMLVLVIVMSFGVRALFATIFFISTGGQYKIWGPAGTFLEDNNDFALALNMTIPMFYYMAQSEQTKWLRSVIRGLMVCVIISVIGTFSRGGLVGLSVIVLALLAKSRHKAMGLVLVGIGLFGVVTFTTMQWKDRMDSFAHGAIDESAESRLIVWRAGWNLVKDYPITGGGFDVYTDSNAFPPYIEEADRAMYVQHGPHSIYLQILGEQGFIGLALFLALMVSCFLTLRKLRKRSSRNPALHWVVPYSHMFEVSLLAYMANGATLGRAYFDLSYQIIACVIVVKILYQQELRLMVEEPALSVEEFEELPVEAEYGTPDYAVSRLVTE